MHKRRLLLILAIGLVGAAAFSSFRDLRMGGKAGSFAPLDKVLATEFQKGWTIAVPPKQEGPYRLAPDSPPRMADTELLFRIRNRDGTTEEIQLKAEPNLDQKVLELETQNGQRTLIGLKRAR